MLPRAWLALLLLLPPAASAQDLDPALSAVVRISATRGDTPVQGSGFVVGVEGGKAMIVTASHVIARAQQIEVTFKVDPTEHYPAGGVLGMDAADDSKGLAVFQVRGALPAGVTSLGFDVESRPQIGDELFLLGFPQMTTTPSARRRALAAWSGTLLVIDQDVGEGFSGGPVLRAGKVVGVITTTDDQNTYAVSARVVRESLDGWGVRLGGQIRPLPLPDPKTCVSGQSRVENGIAYIRICPGTFTMGTGDNEPFVADEKPAHQVQVSELWIGQTEVTNEQYRRFRPDHQGDAALPVTGVSWAEAQAACEHFGGLLPTEAEWEYAARAGSKTSWSCGSDEKVLGEYAWYGEKQGTTPYPAGQKKPNAWGLHDMHGNVFEWVADWYGLYPSVAQTDPTGPATGDKRVVRGGSFADSAGTLRSAFRSPVGPEDRSMYIGFRCARNPDRQP